MRKEFRKLKRIKKRRSFLRNRFFWFGVGIALCAELLFYGIVLFPLLQIQEVRTEGNQEVLGEAIKSVVLDHLWGKLFFFPTASILLVDTKSMQNALLEVLPELETVSIRKRFPNILAVVVQERQTVALWCQPPHLIISSGGQESRCVAIDNKGIAFREADPSPEDITIYGQDQSLDLGKALVKKDILDAILIFTKEVKRRSLFLQDGLSFKIISESQIHARTGEGWDVYLTHAEDLSWQITKLQTVLENKIPPDKRKRLEYIDVRFGDQAYFKYR